MSDRFPEQMLQAGDQNLDPIPGAKLNFFITGTSTPKDTYSDAAKTIPNANPVVADANGRFGDILMDTDVGYKIVYTDAADVTIQTFDPYSPVRSNPIAQIPVVTKSNDFSILDTENGTWFNVDASSGPVTAALPPIADAGNGFHVYIKKIDTSINVVTVDGDGAETIDGSPTFPLPNQNDTALVDANATAWYAFVPSVTTPLPTDHLNGLILSLDAGDTSNDVNITAGSARDGDDTENIVLATEITKQIDAAWSVGDDAGGLDTGTVADGNRYHIWMIKRVDTDVEDALFSLSATAPTMPTNYTKKRMIGYLDRVSAANQLLTKVNIGAAVVQTVTKLDGAVATGTTVLPVDDTIPQITEGDEYMTLAITPTSTSNKLRIDVKFFGAASVAANVGIAIFRDAVASADAAAAQEFSASNGLDGMAFSHVMLAPSTSLITFRVRAGMGAAGTLTFNGTTGSRRLGGLMSSSITITEYAL